VLAIVGVFGNEAIFTTKSPKISLNDSLILLISDNHCQQVELLRIT